MATKELINALYLREKEILNELAAIRSLISLYDTSNRVASVSDDAILDVYCSQEKEVISRAPIPKGKNGWSDYALILLKNKGEAKASEIVKIAIAANPEIDSKTVSNAIKSKLSILYRDGVIDATEGDSKKDGYLYKIKKEPIGS